MSDCPENAQWEGGYYAVIPAEIRYDQELKPNAKLLYGELTALCNKRGYCWAKNEYFSQLYGLSVGTVSRLISQLEAKGYIRCEMAAVASGSERRIYAGAFLVSEGGLDEKRKTPLDKKRKRGLDDFGKHNNKDLNNKELNSPYSPPPGDKPAGKGRRASGAKGAPEWKPERFEGFWRSYPCGKSKQAAIKAWDKLRPDDGLLVAMAKGLQKALASEDWKRGIGIPYAATWLNNRRWEDEDKPLPSGGPGGAPAAPPLTPERFGWD